MGDSVAEIIGGIDNGGGINIDETNQSNITGGIEAEAGPWIDPSIGLHIYGGFALMNVATMSLVWFWYMQNGAGLISLYYWIWFSSLLAVMVSWGPVSLFYPFVFIGSQIFDQIFYFMSLGAIVGPMAGFAVPIVLLLVAYLDRYDKGLIVVSEVHFWLGWAFACSVTAFEIAFQVAFIPNIRLWYDLKWNKQEAPLDEEEEKEEGEEKEGEKKDGEEEEDKSTEPQNEDEIIGIF